MPVLSVICVSVHSGKAFIGIRHRYQSEQGELPGKEQGHRDLFYVLLPVLEEGQEREETEGWLEEVDVVTKVNQSASHNKNTHLKLST